ncbi:transthyretin-like [Pseudochaenichthys georgianus]|uniref:transthyretin-like n=1 Tax=Pseudochaenichthys georgianus TaxID=52239 RepID=UPI00146B2E13|nr:transthyretin-like [Pseudochaenichthys georgianus]
MLHPLPFLLLASAVLLCNTSPTPTCTPVVFEAHAGGHHHYTLALLLSPYSYTTTAVVTDAH